MDIRKVKKLIELLEESGISEIEIHEGEESVRISRGSSVVQPAQTVMHHASVPTQALPAQESYKAHVHAEDHPTKDDYAETGHVITSPMVGVFYSAPSPDEAPFAARGDSVKAGDTLCIIEAMKIMNQIDSDIDGTVKKVLAENGDAVEYGQPLYIIEETTS